MRTARDRTSGENLFVVGLLIAPSSQGLEPPANPERFSYSNPQFDVLLDHIAVETDQAKRQSEILEGSKILYDDAAFIPLY
jgi:ABC-type transport system substrate-binding protein